MHLSSILVGAIGLAGVALAAPNQTTAQPPACTHTITYKWTHGLTSIVREFGTWQTRYMTVDCHGCTAVVQKTVFPKHGGGYTAVKTKTLTAPSGMVGTQRVFVCRTGAPTAEPSVQAKPIPIRPSWRGASKLPAPPKPEEPAPEKGA
ncbi:hypothetical protein TWF481_011502 [Arthrobotrys musiformis]|uniref:Uncharacterized protein n=1 Tax=Arthrobotrys musiformis TaxID=47236 RepID=A0AAV9VZY0_9PEZI